MLSDLHYESGVNRFKSKRSEQPSQSLTTTGFEPFTSLFSCEDFQGNPRVTAPVLERDSLEQNDAQDAERWIFCDLCQHAAEQLRTLTRKGNPHLHLVGSYQRLDARF